MSVIVENAILSFPAIFEPKPNPSGAMKYSCSLLIDKNDKKMIAKIEKAIEAAKQKGKDSRWGGKVPHFTYQPLRDGDAELASEQKTDKIYAGKMFLNCSSDSMPGIVGPTGKKLMDQTAIYAGCIVHVEVNPFPYKNGGNCGIGWGLNNVMKVDDGDRLDGRQDAEDAFAKYAEPEDGEA